MKKLLSFPTLVLVILFTLTMHVTVSAQQATGKIIGGVTDPQGAVVPGARVTVVTTSSQTAQVTRDTITDQDGSFQIPSLPIGTYKITVERDGFKKFISEGNKLQINQVLRIDAPLELGSPSEVVDVIGQAAAVETVNPTLGRSVTSRPIVDLPLNGRNGGGIISVVTKSGTNDFSGSAFEFLRNDALNANSFFNKRDGLPRDRLKRNQFGGTAGGPLILPRFGEGGRSIWNGRNRAFFFV